MCEVILSFYVRWRAIGTLFNQLMRKHLGLKLQSAPCCS